MDAGERGGTFWLWRSPVRWVVAIVAAILAAGLPISPAGADPPTNDLIENATVIDELPFSATQSNVEATSSPDDPPGSLCGFSGFTVWYSMTPAADAPVRISVTGGGFSPHVMLLSGQPGALTDPRCGPSQVRLEGGTSYFFMLASSAPVPSFTFSVEPLDPPANDMIENATVIEALPFAATQDSLEATSSFDDPPGSLCGTAGFTVWYSYTPAVDTVAQVSLSGGNLSTPVLTVLAGEPGELTDPQCGQFGQFVFDAGRTYYFMIGSFTPLDTINLSVEAVTPPENDDVENAILIEDLPFEVTEDSLGATAGADDPPDCSIPGSATMWYRISPADDVTVRVDAVGEQPGFPPTVTVFSGSPGDFVQLPCGAGADLDGGVDYYIMVSFPGGPTTFTLRITEAVFPPNDLIENATAIDALPFETSGSNDLATGSPDDPFSPCGGAAAHSLWYVFTPMADVRVQARVTGEFRVPSVTVYTGPPGSLSDPRCPEFEPVDLLGGTTYYISLSAFQPSPAFTVRLDSTEPSATSLTVDPASATYGGTTTLRATLVALTDPLAGQPVVFSVNGQLVGSATTDVFGVAQLDEVSVAGVPAGDYSPPAAGVAAAFSGDGDRLLPSSGSAGFIVSPAPLVIRADDEAITLGSRLPAFSATYTGLVAGDTPSSPGLDVTFSVAPRPVSRTVPNVYAIVPSGVTSTNYDVTYESGVLTTRYRICPLYSTGRPFPGPTADIRIALCNELGWNLSRRGITVTAVHVARGDETYPAIPAHGSPPDGSFVFDRHLGNGGGYRFRLDTRSLDEPAHYDLVFVVSTDPPGVLQRVPFSLR